MLEIATAGGRLDVDEKEILEFTAVVNDAFIALGEELGGNAESIATDIAKLSSVLGTADRFDGDADAIRRLGSAINFLGANTKAQSQFILEGSQRLAGLANIAGVSEGDLLGLVATLDELGLRTESSTSSVQRFILAIAKDIERFAGIVSDAGVNTKQGFRDLAETDAIEAFNQVLESAKNSESGLKSLEKTTRDLGLTRVLEIETITALAGQTENLRKNQKLGNDEIQRGTSLAEEAKLKNETLGATYDRLINAASNLATNSGLVDFLTDSLRGVNDLVRGGGDLLEYLADVGILLKKIPFGETIFETITSGVKDSLFSLGSLGNIVGSINDFLRGEKIELPAVDVSTLGLPIDRIAGEANEVTGVLAPVIEAIKNVDQAFELSNTISSLEEQKKQLTELRKNVEIGSDAYSEYSEKLKLVTSELDKITGAEKRSEKARQESVKASEKQVKLLEKEAQDLAIIQQQITRDQEKEIAQYEAALLKAATNVERLEISLIPDDFDRQIKEAEFKNKQLIAALGGSPEDIEQQTDLLSTALTNQITQIEAARAKALQDAETKRIQAENARNEADIQRTINVQTNNVDTNELEQTVRIKQEILTVQSDDSLTEAQRIEKERLLQEELTKIQSEAEIERQEIIANNSRDDDEILAAKIAALDEEIAAEKRAAEDIKRIRQETADAIVLGLESAATALNAIQQLQDASSQRDLNGINERYDREVEAAEGNSERIEEIEERRAAAIERVERESFERNKKFAAAQAAINGALAITSILAVPDFTLGIASGIQIALAAVTTAAQIAAINAQTFERGGVVEGLPHSRGGVKAVTKFGQFLELEGDELITNKRTAKSRKMYSVQGTPKQISSALNSINGWGEDYAGGAKIRELQSIRRFEAPQRPQYVSRNGINVSVTGNTDRNFDALEQSLRNIIAEGFADAKVNFVLSEFDKVNNQKELMKQRKYA